MDRALELAMAEPRGPVYLTLPREVLAQPLGELDDLVAGAPPGREPPVPRSRPDRGGGGAARPRAQPADRHRRAGALSSGGGRPGRARRRRRLPGARVEPRLRELSGGAPVPRRLGLREPGLPGDRRGRRRAGRRLRRPLVPGSLAARRRRHRDPARRRPVLLAVPDALVSRATSRWPPSRPWRCRCSRTRSVAASTRPRWRPGAPGSPRRIATQREAWARAAAAEAERTPIGFQWASRCIGEVLGPDTIVVNEYPLDLRHAAAARARDLLRVAPLRRARLGASARRSARSSGRRRRPSSRRSATARTSSARRRPPTSRRSSTSSRS